MKKTTIICVLFVIVMTLDAQIYQHGLVLNGGIGFIDSRIDKSSSNWKEYGYRFGGLAGYRLRFKKPEIQLFHYDIDANFGVKALKSTTYGGYYATSPGFFTSITGTVNYSISKNLSAGLGIEPAYYFRYNRFDIPVVAKIAYNFKAFELGIYGKYGLMNVVEADYLKSLKLREIQLYLFIPFKR